MGKYEGEERRFIRRHRVNCVSVTYKRPRLLGLLTSPESRACDVSDINWRGMRFYAANRLRRGTVISVLLDCFLNASLSNNGRTVKARIAWQRWSKTHRAWRTGAAFLDLRDAERDGILKMLEGAVALDRRHHEEDEDA